MDERLRLWTVLGVPEAKSRARNAAWLADIEPSIEVLHDAPNGLTAIPDFSGKGRQARVAGACIKRALDDLRAMWLLLNAGYTSAAGAVCADLWEHSMLASCAALSDDVASRFEADTPDDSSLNAKQLSEQLSSLLEAGLSATPTVNPNDAARWQACGYVAYKWLCQVKHPTFRAIQHTTRTSLSGDGRLGLSAHPDASDADRDVKGLMLLIAFGVLQKAVILLGVLTIGNNPSVEVRDWQKRLEAAETNLKASLPPATINPPWSVADTKAGRRARELSRGTSGDSNL